MSYEIKLKTSGYAQIGEAYGRTELERTLKFRNWDDAKDFVGLMVDASDDTIELEIMKKGK